MTKDQKDKFQFILGGSILVLDFIIIGMLLWKDIPSRNERLLDIAIGIILGWGGIVVTWFFSSTKGSAEKTEMLANSTPLVNDNKDLNVTN
jgi:hypothetical protein